MLTARQDWAFLGFHRHHSQRGFARFEHLPDPRDRAPGPDARDKDVDIAAGIVPDFLRRRAAMDVRIGRIFELLWHYSIWCCAYQLFGRRDRALHPLPGGG